jgi:hypothetical protein
MSGIAYTYDELVAAGVGKYIPTRTAGYDQKKKAYSKEKVWQHFARLRDEYRLKFTDATGYVDQEMANKTAQAETDNLLLKRAEGKAVALPNDDPEPTEPDGDEFLLPAELFEKPDVPLDPLQIIDYVFDNIGIKDVKPEDAPSAGAYAYLKHVQQGPERMADFYKSVWSKTIPSKSLIEDVRNQNDDGRSNFELLERLEAEMGEDGSGEIPVLLRDLEIESRSQDEEG